MKILSTLAILFTAVATAAEPPKAVKPDTLKDTVSVTLGEEFSITFQRDGDVLSKPAKVEKPDTKLVVVKVKLATTTASPVPPPREGAVRPFLLVENGFDKPLHCRALVRMKGSKEFFAMSDGLEPVPAKDFINKCWGFDDQVEEIVL
jgi:hypothetical protein